MIRNAAISLLFLLVPLVTHAELEAKFTFNGQNAEAVTMEKAVTVQRPVPRQVQSTCYKQVPYQAYECSDVTRYKEECTWVPARQDCRTEYEQSCRSVTRYRSECHSGPSRQECHTTPSRQVCTDRPQRQVCHDRPSRQVCHERPSRQVCTDRPSREVCTERPTREVCTTRPDGRQHCTTVGGGQHCTTVGGGQSCTTVGGGQECTTVGGGQECTWVGGGQDCRTVGGEYQCRTVPGEQICRDVPYQDQECTQIPRQVCETIPAHNECEQVPYTEEVCGNVTRYKQEAYACMKTEYVNEPFQKKVSGAVNISIITNGLVEEFPVLIGLVPKSDDMREFDASVKLPVDPKVLVMLRKHEARVTAETEKDIKVEGEVTLELIEAKNTVEFPTKVNEAAIEESTKKIEVLFKGKLPQTGKLDLELTYKDKVVATISEQYPSDKIKVTKLQGYQALVVNLKSVMTERVRDRMTLKLKLSVPMTIEGEVLNANKPQSEKLFEKIKVETF